MKPAPLPMMVIAGYLGAGKTSLINRLLAEDHGQRILVMVNDFGAINIDEQLLQSRNDDTITLTNGCVCCTMGADLFMAIGDVLDREPCPDALVIEASGIADPKRIAQVALAEPDLRYGGILTVVDAQAFEGLAQDALIGPQILDQVVCADLVAVSKTNLELPHLERRLTSISTAPKVYLDQLDHVSPLILDHKEPHAPKHAHPSHPQYCTWSYQGPARLGRMEIETLVKSRPKGAFRVKGFIQDHQSKTWEVHAVGAQLSVTPAVSQTETKLVILGAQDHLQNAALDAWWQIACAPIKEG